MSSKFVFISIGGIVGFFSPLYVLVIWMLMFVCVDLITGLWSSRKNGILWTSDKLRKTVSKTTLYAMVIVLLHAIDVQILPFSGLELARVATSIICSIELYSILENAYKITDCRVFYILTQFTLKKIEDVSGVNMQEQLNKKD
jgi:phage-related holin